MALSQFKLFSSMDTNAPILNGVTGSLIPVLNYCLINGTGWIQPSASFSFNNPSVNNIAVYQQPSGSICILYVNDAGPGAALGKEAQVKGWDSLITMSAPFGTGSNEFPRFGQLLTNGHITVAKSATANTTVNRPWYMFADAYTFYLFILSGDTAGTYQSLFFGDIFSLQGPSDTQKCQIQGRMTDNSPTSTTDQNDIITGLTLSFTAVAQGSSGFINRTCGGVALSNWISKLGDMSKTTTPATTLAMAGTLPCPNSSDKSIYMVPIFISEAFGTVVQLRGRMRGMYHICHPIASFYDGQMFYGTGEYFGKTFMVIKQGFNGGMWCIETSPTIETN